MKQGIFGTSQQPVQEVSHLGIRCDNCEVCPVVGKRYKCSTCPNYDLCSRCMDLHDKGATGSHVSGYIFYRLPNPVPNTAVSFFNLSRHTGGGEGFQCATCGDGPIRGYAYDCSFCFTRRCMRCEQTYPCPHMVTKFLLCAEPQAGGSLLSVDITTLPLACCS